VILFSLGLEAAIEFRNAGDSRSENLLVACPTNVRTLRRRYAYINNTVLAANAWTLRRSRCVRDLFKFRSKGARDNQARDSNLAVEMFMSDMDEPVVCCNRADENCLTDGCALRAVVLTVLDEVMAATGMDLRIVLGLLSEDLRVPALNQGVAVFYGSNLCVVRREGGS